MTEIQVSSSTAQLSREEYEATLARLRAYSNTIKTVMADAQRGSMAAAADLTAVYEARYWVDQLPAIRVSHRRGQPVKADSMARFAQWVDAHPEQIGDVFSADRISQMMSAHRIAVEYFRPGQINSDQAVRPLRKYLKGRESELRDISQRVIQLTDGGPVTPNAVKLAVHDHKQSLIPPKVASSGRKTTTDHAAIIRSEFRILLNSKRFRDAGALLNELRAELMTAAGISE